MAFEIKKGMIRKAIRVVVYGPEGIGKSTFASQFPGAVFIDTEGSTNQMDVARFPAPTSWEMLLQEVEQVIKDPTSVGTLVIDTVDWAQAKCVESVCAKYKADGIESFGYGKGYSYVYEEFGKLLNLLNDVIDKGTNVVLVAHSAIRTFTKPDEMGQYDRYELKLISTPKCSITGMVKEWSDLLLFANYETFITEDSKTKKKYATGNRRVMYTEHTAAYDAKNRFGMPSKLDFDYKEISRLFTSTENEQKVKDLFGAENVEIIREEPKPKEEPVKKPVSEPVQPKEFSGNVNYVDKPAPYTAEEEAILKRIPKALAALMRADTVHPKEIMEVVGEQGHWPSDMPIDQYSPDYYLGFLIPNWSLVFNSIAEKRSLPF